MKRIYRITILFLIISISLLFAFSISRIQSVSSARTIGGQVEGPLPCQSLVLSPLNLLPVLDTYGFIVDGAFRFFMSDNGNLRWNIVRSGPDICGGWYGIQTLLYNAGAGTPMGYADDTNDTEFFYEVYDNMPAPGGVWRDKKDGTSRVQIYTSGAGGQNPAGCAFDKLNNKITWSLDSGAPIGVIRRCNPDGTGVQDWNILALFGIQARGVGIFEDGRLVLYVTGGNRMRLYTGWGGAFIQEIIPPAAPIWFSMDNVNNRVYCGNNISVWVWDIATNTILISHVWGGANNGQCSYRSKDGFVYTKALGGGPIRRWNYATGVAESWTGTQILQ